MLNARVHSAWLLTRSFVGYVTAFFQGQLIIAIIMAFMLAAGFTLIGLKGAIVLGILLGLLNILPFLVTIVGLLVNRLRLYGAVALISGRALRDLDRLVPLTGTARRRASTASSDGTLSRRGGQTRSTNSSSPAWPAQCAQQ